MKTMLKLVAVTSLMLAAVVACGKKADRESAGETTTTSAAATARASCTMVSELGTCNEYRNGQSFGLEKSLCEGFKGTFTNAGCSTNGQIGACTMSDGEVKRYYGSKVAGDHGLTVEEAKIDCQSESVKGTFVVDPNAAAAMAPVAKAAIPADKLAPTVKATASIRAKN
ncbi:MAG TPA: hypothetical protein VLT33_33070 [Labilithrix sp.]|nr:hypothetical protein [Labilithrix sp.]